jgi:hypothetical protein
MRSVFFKVLAACAAASLFAGAAAADNPLLLAWPQLRGYPAPFWLKEGVKITYYSSAASVPDTRYLYYRDDAGGWIDTRGNRYRREETSGSGGHGYTEVTIAGVDSHGVALDVRSLGITDASGPLRPIASVADVGLPGAAGDWWIHPDFLATIRDGEAEGVRILRMPYAVRGVTYKAIRLQYDRGDAKSAWVYDLATGILLYAGSASSGALSGAFTKELGKGTQGILSQSTFAGFRELRVPWRNDPPPPWIATLRTAAFEGSQAVILPGSPVFPFAMRSDLRVTARGDRWIRYRTNDTIASVPGLPPRTSETDRVSGVGQFCGLWAPPAGLARLRAGEVLDTDPITGSRIVVAASDASSVTLREQGSGYTFDIRYDRATGAMTNVRLDDRTINQTVEMRRTR